MTYLKLYSSCSSRGHLSRWCFFISGINISNVLSPLSHVSSRTNQPFSGFVLLFTSCRHGLIEQLGGLLRTDWWMGVEVSTWIKGILVMAIHFFLFQVWCNRSYIVKVLVLSSWRGTARPAVPACSPVTLRCTALAVATSVSAAWRRSALTWSTGTPPVHQRSSPLASASPVNHLTHWPQRQSPGMTLALQPTGGSRAHSKGLMPTPSVTAGITVSPRHLKDGAHRVLGWGRRWRQNQMMHDKRKETKGKEVWIKAVSALFGSPFLLLIAP